MIVYVESNFILEIAYLQEEHEQAESLLAFAASGRITLILPAFCVGEPYETWTRRKKQRAELHQRLEAEVRQLSRSKPYTQESQDLRNAMALLIRSSDEEKRRLDAALERILDLVEVIPISAAIFRAAIGIQQNTPLAAQDAMIYASILQHLQAAPQTPKCFVTKNANDFLEPNIQATLAHHACRLLTRFRDAVGYARSQTQEGSA